MRNIIKTNKAPAAIGTYSQAVESNGILFTSGQVGIDPETSEMVEGGVADQAIRVLKNIYAILSESGLDKTSIIKLNVFLKDLDDFSIVNDTFKEFFGDNEFPARTTVEVSELPLGALIEIDCIASR
ncbi:MAG: RidA family protein [bacterium TMED46]|nr:MAG: RidA family protein [bacterium TMED46]|tara:strand:+ start:4221 stop:4601 length:381 start_codon:yes stop_codon:yes gene_type:complete